MKQAFKKCLGLCLALAVTSGIIPADAWAADNVPAAKPAIPYAAQLSANIPLDSHVYHYLEKLDGLGYLHDMLPGNKPYTRMQVAVWVEQMDQALKTDQAAPTYAKNMIFELKSEFQRELSMLRGGTPAKEFGLNEWKFAEEYNHGNTLQQQHTKSAYQPLNINNNGYRYGAGANEILALTLEGRLNNDLVLSLTPRFSYDNSENGNVSLESGYVKTRISNTAIQIGKDAESWGQGTRGHLLFSNHATPQAAIKISNIAPVQTGGFFKFLGKQNTTLYYSILETNREIPYPSFVVFRKDFTPNENFTFALAHGSIIGGQGHMLGGRDYPHWLLGINADSSSADKWDSIGGGDFRWRIPKWNGIQLYGEAYGEDQYRCLLLPMPSKFAEIGGIYIPRLTKDGSWDAQLEVHHTTNFWYDHSLYTDGWTYKGNIMGDAIGNNARS